MTLTKYYAFLIGLVVCSSSCMVAMKHSAAEKITSQNNNNEEPLCYLCTDELDGRAVLISEACEHRLHEACYARIMADERYNKNCFICSRVIVRPEKNASQGKPLLRLEKKDNLLKERERYLKRLIIMSRDTKRITSIKGSRELMSLRNKDIISHEDYTTLQRFATKKDALGLEAFLQELRRKK